MTTPLRRSWDWTHSSMGPSHAGGGITSCWFAGDSLVLSGSLDSRPIAQTDIAMSCTHRSASLTDKRRCTSARVKDALCAHTVADDHSTLATSAAAMTVTTGSMTGLSSRNRVRASPPSALHSHCVQSDNKARHLGTQLYRTTVLMVTLMFGCSPISLNFWTELGITVR